MDMMESFLVSFFDGASRSINTQENTQHTHTERERKRARTNNIAVII